VTEGPQSLEAQRNAVLGIVPHLLWAALLLFILLWIGRDGLNALAGRVQKVGAFGVELEFRQELERAATDSKTPISGTDLGRASRRLARDQALVNGSRILWIDDLPANNEAEMRVFEEAGARVDVHTSSNAAREAVERVRYDLVVSDIGRDDPTDNALRFAELLATMRGSPPLIFYTSTVRKPTPASAFGITDRPDELVHLVLDAIARTRS
jgi:CheY-like chemotaxis protein